jgi:hypothetical protein
MNPMRSVCVLLALIGTARAQRSEVTPAQCSDHIDNDRNGLIDCEDPKCGGLPQCKLVLLDPLADQQPLTGKGQITAGVVMLLAGPALAGASAAVFLDAEGQEADSKRTLEFVMGGVLTAAGTALAITGVALINKGWRRYKEDVEMGLAWNRVQLRVRF